MRKNINKLVAFAIGVSVISGSIIPAFAEDATAQNTSTITNVQANVKPVLTLSDSINAAISNSETLQLDEKKISSQNKIDYINQEIEDNNNISNDQENFNDDTREININKLEQKREFDEDNLIQKTTKVYNDIVTSKLKIDKAEKGLEIQNKLLSDAKLKSNLGLMTTIDLTSAEIQIETLQNQLKSNQNALIDLQYSFKVLTGKDVTQYTLEQDSNYETFKIDQSVDDYLDNVIDKYLKYSEELLALNKEYYKDDDNYISLSSTSSVKFKISELTTDAIDGFKTDITTKKNEITAFDDTTISSYVSYLSTYKEYTDAATTYAEALAGRLVYLNTKLGVSENETTLDEAKKTYKESLRSIYTNINGLEDNITTLNKNIALNNKQLSNAKLKYDLGLMTKSDYDTLVVNSEDLQIQLRSLIDSHNTLKEEIQKPWIIFSK